MPNGQCDGIHQDCRECSEMRKNRAMAVRLVGFAFVFGALVAVLHLIGTR